MNFQQTTFEHLNKNVKKSSSVKYVPVDISSSVGFVVIVAGITLLREAAMNYLLRSLNVCEEMLNVEEILILKLQ